MGAKFHVQAVSRQGYDGFSRAGRKWPSGAPVEVEVLDQDEDPPHDPAKGVRIGKQTYATLKAESNLVIRAPGDPLEHAQNIEAIRAENAALKAQLAKHAPAATAAHPRAVDDGAVTEAEAARKRR